MNEIEIKFNLREPQQDKREIDILITNDYERELLYKFVIGYEGLWTTLKDYSHKKQCLWIPKEEGEYIIMIQGKKEDSKKPFDYVSRVTYNLGKDFENKLMEDVNLDKDTYILGEKLNLKVHGIEEDVLYRYWIKSGQGWELIKDYSLDNTLSFVVRNKDFNQVLVECKKPNSINKYDDFKIVTFSVEKPNSIEITDFKFLNDNEALIGQELIFQVDTCHSDNRTILYKFYKIDRNGYFTCLQDYSTKKIFTYIEKDPGEYRILCMVKDIYSLNEYEDRAVLTYNVKPYKDITIKTFTSDMASPQLLGRDICFQTVVSGGADILYRFVIDGPMAEDSGYVRDNTFIWKSKTQGKYTIKSMVKDSSYEGQYEAMSIMEYEITEEQYAPIRIKNVILDKTKNFVKNEAINIKVHTEGGINPLFQFKVLKDKEELESIDYGVLNWVNFTPESEGIYDLQIRVKDLGSLKEYDCETSVSIEVKDHIPATIDYVLINAKEYYRVRDKVLLEVVTENNLNILIKYVLKINDRIVEETNFSTNIGYSFIPQVSGKYTVDIYSKNKNSSKEYECKKEVNVIIHEELPITDTKISCSKTNILVNESVDFFVSSNGGKDVCYEFYLMEKGQWKRIQSYSKKSYYSFMPFYEGEYRLLVLAKSFYKKCAYEDYVEYKFTAEKNKIVREEEAI